jgi:class 3 adenylate cyclase/TolB-like protein
VPPEPAQPIERKLAAIFAADVAGYSRLISQDETGTLRTLTAHREVMDRLIAQHRGRIANTAGDSVLAEFPSVVDAVRCAVEVQERLGQANSTLTEDHRLRFRIGIHLGDVVVVRAGDLLGEGVNVAARLESIACPGGITLSAAVYDQVRKTLPLVCTDLGPTSLKNLEEPVRAYAVRSPTLQAPSPPDGRSLPLQSKKPALAVLPFTNLSGDVEQQYFADGLREDLIAALVRVSGLVVLSPNSHLAGQSQSVASPSGAYLLAGTVRRSDTRVRVTAQLTHSTGESLWAEKYDFGIDDLFATQDKLALSIPAALKVKVEEYERQYALTKPPSNLAAYDFYLRGRHFERSFDRRERARARSMFLSAIKADPGYARGYLGLAWWEIRTLKWGEPTDRDAALVCALDAALTATALDPSDADCHWALGLIYLWKREPGRAMASYERARSLSPSHPDLLSDMADALTYFGRLEEAIQLGQTALALNPNKPDWYMWNVAAAFYLSGNYEEALRHLEQMAQPGPAYRLLAATYAQLGRQENAREAAEELLKVNPDFSISRFAAQAPYTRNEELARYVSGLRMAGLPE